MHEDDRRFLRRAIVGAVSTTVGVVALIIGIAVPATWWQDSHGCAVVHEQTGVATKYHFGDGGCFVNVNGQWVPLDNWRSR